MSEVEKVKEEEKIFLAPVKKMRSFLRITVIESKRTLYPSSLEMISR